MATLTARSVITATVAGSGETRDEVQDDSPIEQRRLAAHFRMFRGDFVMRLRLSLLSLVLLSTVACVTPPQHAQYRHQAPAPCKPHVPPINYTTIVTSISVNYTYTPKDASAARPWHQGDVLEYLNTLGRQNGDTFVAQNGQPLNFTFVYTINNDGQDHFTGSLQFSGWGWGYINTFNTQYAYSDTSQMTRDLTDQAFAFIKGGWHDTRTSCPQS